MVARINAAVSGALAAKGWTEVPSGGDAAVMAIEMTRDQQILNTFYDGFGGAAGVGEDSEMPRQLSKHTKWGLWVVDVFDTNTHKLIWRGSASGTLSDNSGKNVSKLFQHFPPGWSRD